MNVVGRVGSLISQGVYSVATPFHPFGGAVDIIVVQQEDGTFRSTPWYVRFGKFQGVLKGAEKIVRINVNGIEASFHMCLENSGEAYFVREDVSSSEEIQAKELIKSTDDCATVEEENTFSGSESTINCSQVVSSTTAGRVDTMVSNSGVAELKNWSSSYVEHVEPVGGQQFFEFSEFQSKVGGASVELTEFRSNRRESLDNIEHLMETQDSDSEVVLFSVDGHVLTAPVSSSEDDTQNLQLYTPQFHLGPGDGDDFCEGSTSFVTREGTWAADYISKLEGSSKNESKYTTSGSISVHQSALSDQTGDDIKQIKYTNCSISIHESTVCDEIGDDMQEISANVGQIVEIQECSTQRFTDSVPNKDGEYISCVTDKNGVFDDHLSTPNEITSPLDRSPRYIEAGGFYHNDETVHPTPEVSSPFQYDPLTYIVMKDLDTQAEDEISLCAENTENASLVAVPTGDSGYRGLVSGITEKDVTCRHLPSPSCESGVYINKVLERVAASSQRGSNDDNVGSEQVISAIEISICGENLFDGMGLSEATEAFDAHRVSEDEFKNSAPSVARNDNLIVRYKGSYLRWGKAAHIILGLAAFGLDLPIDSGDVIQVEGNKTSAAKNDASKIELESSPSRRWRLWPIPFRRVKTMENANRNSSNEGSFVVSDSPLPNTQTESSVFGNEIMSPHKQFIKTNIPTTEQIASLNLKEGQNIITFRFSTRVLGTQEVDAHIYLWMWNAQIVISDVDGTITRSDVLGQFMPLVGRDWSQFGVTQLFSAIRENGYQLLFLSARAIVQAYLTRSFLLNLKQDGKALPNGPVVISPDGLFPSLYREVIRRAPHEFKIACLQDIKALFPVGYNPFYAGFGNRDTDELSYRKIGIPKGKIFIINPKGEVAINNRVDVKSYTSLHTLVNDMFPPASLVEQEDFNSWNFWKMPLSCIDVDI